MTVPPAVAGRWLTMLGAWWAAWALAGAAQAPAADETFSALLDHPAIAYETTRSNDAVVRLVRRLESGAQRLEFEPGHGCLRSSYLVYSEAFDALPPLARDAVYARVWRVLSGAERGTPRDARLSGSDRQAIVEILRGTKPDLPPYFQEAVR
jgi:hypothetical protein